MLCINLVSDLRVYGVLYVISALASTSIVRMDWPQWIRQYEYSNITDSHSIACHHLH